MGGERRVHNTYIEHYCAGLVLKLKFNLTYKCHDL